MTDRPDRIVLCLGNPMRGDDGVGLAVAAALARSLERDPIEGVGVATSERGGLEILDLIAGARAAVLVDCLELPAAEPGRARWLTWEELEQSPRLAGMHDLDLPGVLRLGRVLGVPMPETVRVLGIEARPAHDLNDRLSPPVAACVEQVAARLLEELRQGPLAAGG